MTYQKRMVIFFFSLEVDIKLDELSERLEIDLCSLLENGADPYCKGGGVNF